MPDLKLSMIVTAVDRITAPLRRITDAQRRLVEAVKQSKERLAAIGQQSKLIASYRELRQAVGGSRVAFEALALKARAMRTGSSVL